MKHLNYDQALMNVSLFLPEDKEILDIIKFCQLRPSEDSWKIWHDHLGNHINISNDKKPSSYKDSPLSHTNKIITDLYYKSLPKQLGSFATQTVILFGEGDKATSNVAFIWLLGKDNRLRLLTYAKNEWIENYPPLSIGLKTLRTIVRNLKIKQNQAINTLDLKGPVAATILKGWVSNWPPDNKLKLEMLLVNKILTAAIIKDFNL